MSHADWMRLCNQSHSVELNSLLTRLDAASFTAVVAYTTAVFVAVFFLLRWFKLSASNKNELWNGFKLFFISIVVGCVFGCARQIVNRQAYTVVFVDG